MSGTLAPRGWRVGYAVWLQIRTASAGQHTLAARGVMGDRISHQTQGGNGQAGGRESGHVHWDQPRGEAERDDTEYDPGPRNPQ